MVVSLSALPSASLSSLAIFMDHHIMLLTLQLLIPSYNATLFHEPDHANIQRLRQYKAVIRINIRFN
jgi:hypothetical protein